MASKFSEIPDDKMRLHVRHVMLYLFRKGFTLQEASQELKQVYGSTYTDGSVSSYFRKFRNGDFNLDDRRHENRRQSLPLETLEPKVRKLFETNLMTDYDIANVLKHEIAPVVEICNRIKGEKQQKILQRLQEELEQTREQERKEEQNRIRDEKQLKIQERKRLHAEQVNGLSQKQRNCLRRDLEVAIKLSEQELLKVQDELDQLERQNGPIPVEQIHRLYEKNGPLEPLHIARALNQPESFVHRIYKVVHSEQLQLRIKHFQNEKEKLNNPQYKPTDPLTVPNQQLVLVSTPQVPPNLVLTESYQNSANLSIID